VKDDLQRTTVTLRETDARFRLIADAVPQIVWLCDAGGRVEFFNKQWTDYTGETYERTTAAHVAVTHLHPDDVNRTLTAFGEAVTSGRTMAIEHRVRSRDGEYRWFLLNANPYRDPDTGKIVRWFGASVDIHARKTAEAALHEADRRKDEFLAVLAHELRNPLAPIRTGLELIRLAGDAPDSVRDVRRMMERQIGYMVRLIDDLLDVSRITAGKIRLNREPTTLHALVNSAIDTNRTALAQKQIELQVELPDGTCNIEVDPTRFVQVVSNLLNNAAKFTDPGGAVYLRAHTDGDELIMSVKDTGIGIPAELRPRIFELFMQGERTSPQAGLGIGLALARQLTEMHGGTIDVQSDGPGHGSTFVVRMPVAAPFGNLAH
jgi:PAS domain S-box-containing protein